MPKYEKKIVAIGGGEITTTPAETLIIDKEILKLTNRNHPTLLFIPTASGDAESYYSNVKDHFINIGFSQVDVLYLLKKTLTHEEIKNAILSHDAIYVGGGNTLKMMIAWRKYGVDKLLKQALDNGIVLSGLSAGSICWFSKGSSDFRRFANGSNKLGLVTGLGFIDAVHCPHYDAEPHRQQDIKEKMKHSPQIAICLDNCTALEIVGDKYKIIRSRPSAKARRAYWRNGEYYLEDISNHNTLTSLDELLSK